MPVFIERFILAAMAAAFIAVVFVNPLKFDKIQRTTAALALFFGAAFFAQTLYRHSQSSAEASEGSANPASKQASANETTKADEPNLKGEFATIGAGDARTNPPVAAIFITASIRNSGAPSIVEKYYISVKVPGQPELVREPTHLLKDLELLRDGNSGMAYKISDALYNKTAPQPIPKGGIADGFLAFYFEGMTRDEIFVPGTIVTLFYSDVTGKKYSISHTISGGEGDFLYLPGVNGRVIPPPKTPGRPKRSRSKHK